MSRLPPNRLTALHISRHKSGSICDGGGLWLVVSGGSRLWELRFKSPVTGKRRQMGLGSAFDLSLADARSRASDCRRLLKSGLDPIVEREKDKATRKLETGLSFEEVATRYIQEQTPGWKDHKAAATWTGSLSQHVFSVFGKKAVRNIDTQDVLAALRPIWTEKTETAGRLRGRIERILDYARAQGWREGENPARWRGHLSATLPPPSKLMKVQHHKAVGWKDIAPVITALRASEGIAAKAVRFCCLTAARSGEVRNAAWSEIDMTAQIWTIPDHKMKAGREHRVPLSDDALAILQEMLPLRDKHAGDLVFPGHKSGKPLSDVALSKALHLAAKTKDVTVHGLRSTFRDWTSDTSACPREVAEMALAHAIENKVEAAYRRTDLLDQRRPLMEAWAEQCRE
ncbi:phage integrase [Acetobacter cibinongensis]|uniref:Phage integrase n=1 Tax=Acetobacter cibinongensis TaxID=146475 RepID=A0A0D6N7S5_9PROT|nr:integrase arm-type DNA-binding domain-containing protein [Acetobacter cibinongensis]GAN61546.1 phage integrase [Acetobacter cibinongensis]GBQ14459.1 phage integrase [Acetobacter cibinongensis NRIC 0482]GEL60073.1 phage integrase [Acetobacter cibinongensis]